MNTPRILLFGKGGQVATELVPLLSVLGELTVSGPDDCSFEDLGSVERKIIDCKPDIIVNAAAYTAVDRAESEEALCFAVNAAAVAKIADTAKQLNALVVHYSTDYVFDGMAAVPYTEDDKPHPQGVYGKSKREGEVFLENSGASFMLFRTAWVYSSIGKNFMKTMLTLGKERKELSVVKDQFGCPTSAKLISVATAFALQKWWQSGKSVRSELEGTYNLVASGSCSWHEFAEAIFEGAREYISREKISLSLNLETVHAICTSEYPTAAKRPAYSVLQNTKFQQVFGLNLPPWNVGLNFVLSEYLNRHL